MVSFTQLISFSLLPLLALASSEGPSPIGLQRMRRDAMQARSPEGFPAPAEHEYVGAARAIRRVVGAGKTRSRRSTYKTGGTDRKGPAPQRLAKRSKMVKKSVAEKTDDLEHEKRMTEQEVVGKKRADVGAEKRKGQALKEKRNSRMSKRADEVGQAVCTDPDTQLSSHDCNVALLSLGGGIAGAIEFLRVDSTTNTATSGTCSVTVTTDDGGNIDISKGRLEHGGVAGFDDFISTCGASPGTLLIEGGSTTGGNTLLTIAST